MQTTTTMTQNRTVQELSTQFDTFNQELLSFIHACSEAGWAAVTVAEGWPVNVTARHIAVAHYPIIEWLQMLSRGESLPPVTMDMVDQLNGQHAQEHQSCTKEEVSELLQTNYANMVDYLMTLNDEKLKPQGYVKLFEANMSAADFFQVVCLDGPTGHLASMKSAGKQ